MSSITKSVAFEIDSKRSETFLSDFSNSFCIDKDAFFSRYWRRAEDLVGGTSQNFFRLVCANFVNTNFQQHVRKNLGRNCYLNVHRRTTVDLAEKMWYLNRYRRVLVYFYLKVVQQLTLKFQTLTSLQWRIHGKGNWKFLPPSEKSWPGGEFYRVWKKAV